MRIILIQSGKSCLYAYAEYITDDNEFMKIYDTNKSMEIYGYWNFEKSNLEYSDDAQCLPDFPIK